MPKRKAYELPEEEELPDLPIFEKRKRLRGNRTLTKRKRKAGIRAQIRKKYQARFRSLGIQIRSLKKQRTKIKRDIRSLSNRRRKKT